MGSIIALVIGIVILLWLIIKTKIQAFPALIFTSIIVGLMAGLPSAETMKAVSGGFGGTLGSIGIVIGFGCIMGKFLEKSGAAKKMALTILKFVGIKRADVALGLSGLLVGIPVFCDSGFVILAELAKEFSRITKKSMVGLGGILGMGLYITHFLVPPTPGPLAVAGFFKVDLGVMILSGILLSIPIFIISIAYFRYAARKFPALIPERSLNDLNVPEDQKKALERIIEKRNKAEELGAEDFTELAADEKLPGTFMAFAPIMIPVLLILTNTIANTLKIGGTAGSVIGIIGNPIVAVFIAVLFSVYGLCSTISRQEAIKIMESSLADAGLIILVTGAGGALGNVIRVTNIGDTIARGIIDSNIPVILVPLLLGALLRIPQGSGTVAMITGGSILAPMIGTLGIEPVIAALCLCSTAMFISYPNDSYFWVVTRFSGMDVETSLKSWSIGTALIPLSASIILIVANMFV
jgi:GntP family gluconate:H+ symporter